MRSSFEKALADCGADPSLSRLSLPDRPAWSGLAAQMKGVGLRREWRELVAAAVDPEARLPAVAQRCHVHPSHLNRKLLPATGLTFLQLRSRIRLALAVELLRTTDTSVFAAALAAGFDSRRSLERWCRRLLGCSPREAREVDEARSAALAMLGEPAPADRGSSGPAAG